MIINLDFFSCYYRTFDKYETLISLLNRENNQLQIFYFRKILTSYYMLQVTGARDYLLIFQEHVIVVESR